MRQFTFILLSILIAVTVYFLLPESCPEAARRTAFIFVIAALFWALELIPLYATSLLVVLLSAFLLTRPNGPLGLGPNGYTVFLIPFSNPVIMLFMGGFVLAQSFRKYGIDRWIVVNVFKHFGERPYGVLLGLMIATAFLSLWLSNTATTALMLAMVGPMLAGLERRDPFRKAVVLGIAFAAMIGGIGTPISTPPNAIAVGLLAERGIRLDFFAWMKMAVPLAAILIFLTSLLLMRLFPARKTQVSFSIEHSSPFGFKEKLVVAIAVLTACLWLTSGLSRIPESITALLCVAALAGFSLINREDFKAIDWDILVLMWGGLALGEAMEISGLARWVVDFPIFSQSGFILLVLFCVAAVLLSTFMSNTATVNLLVPIALSIPGIEPVKLAVVIALASSFDIALPIATPPMAMAYGTQEVRVKDMLKAGIWVSLIANLFLLAGFEFVMTRTLIPQ